MVYVSGKQSLNNAEILCYKMDAFEIDKKTHVVIAEGYRGICYINGKYYDIFTSKSMDIDKGLIKNHKGDMCIIYSCVDSNKKIQCKYGVGKSGKVLNSYGDYTVSLLAGDGVRNLINAFNVEINDVDATKIRDRINPIIPEAFSKSEVVDLQSAKKVLNDTLNAKLSEYGLRLEVINIEGFNMED